MFLLFQLAESHAIYLEIGMQELLSSPYPLPLAQTSLQQDTEQAEHGFKKKEMLLFPQHLSQLYFPNSLQ